MNSPELTERARELRKNPTPAEAALWEHLRNDQLDGLKFRRQHPISGFILDFYCKKARLDIELDGSVHLDPDQKDLDIERTRELEDAGIMILRFWNREVLESMSEVLEKIKKSVEERKRLSRKSLTPKFGDNSSRLCAPSPTDEQPGHSNS